MRDTTQIDFIGQPMTPQQVVEAQQQRAASRRASGGLGQGSTSLSSSLASAASSAARSMVRGVTLRSQITPDATYDPNAPAPPTEGFSGWFTRTVVKPAFVIETPGGSFTYAPYGEPTKNLFPVIALGTAALLGVGGYFAVKGIRAALKG